HTVCTHSICVLFFFQAEDGIRDRNVTGVQTCALPISVYLMVALTVVLLVVMYRMQTSMRQRRAVWSLAAVLVFQGLVGYYQHLNDLPIGAVWLHMFGIGLVTWAMTVVLDIFNSKYETVPTQHDLARNEEPEALTHA